MSSVGGSLGALFPPMEVVDVGRTGVVREGGGSNGGVVENNRTYSTNEPMPT